jgi:hypothetical protein
MRNWYNDDGAATPSINITDLTKTWTTLPSLLHYRGRHRPHGSVAQYTHAAAVATSAGRHMGLNTPGLPAGRGSIRDSNPRRSDPLFLVKMKGYQ